MFSDDHGFSIQAFQEGDRKAFNFIFTCYYPSLCFFASRLIAGSPIAEDITQEAFVRLWQKHESFNCQQSIKAFLYIITRNACLNFIKHWQRQKNYQHAWARSWNEEEDCVLNKLTRLEIFNEVYTAVNMLPAECRKIMWLSHIEGFRNNEIADQLHISINTVKNQKTRGLHLLKKECTLRIK